MKRIAFVSIISGILLSSLSFGYSGGDGLSERTAYRISKSADWVEFMGTTADWTGKYFVLTVDIDMSGWSFSDAVISPDVDSSTYGFQGIVFTSVFDGGGHEISGFTISSSGDFVGLFGYVGSGGQIKNLGVVNASIEGRDYVGGLVGRNIYGTINSCNVMGSVIGKYSVGGLVGCNDYNGKINSCYATGDVSGTDDAVGGLAGFNFYGTIDSCYAGDLINGGTRAGGLVGINEKGTISCCYATGAVEGTEKIGGLVGINYQGKVIHCYSTCRPSGTGNVGGLCGWIDSGGDYEDTGNFWDIETSEEINSWMGISKTTAEMQTLWTFIYAGWDFITADGDPADWMMPTLRIYPHLIWEDIPPCCGDAEHPYPPGDVNQDCHVNLSDFAILAANWLDCTAPECD